MVCNNTYCLLNWDASACDLTRDFSAIFHMILHTDHQTLIIHSHEMTDHFLVPLSSIFLAIVSIIRMPEATRCLVLNADPVHSHPLTYK